MCLGYFDPENVILDNEWADLTDVSAKTATLVMLRRMYHYAQNIRYLNCTTNTFTVSQHSVIIIF